MHIVFRSCLLSLLLVLTCWGGVSLPTVAQTSAGGSAPALSWEVAYLAESGEAVVRPSQLPSLLAGGAFASWADEGSDINLGFSPFGHWLHVRIVNAGQDHITQVLELAYASPDWVDVYLPDGKVVLTGALRERPADQLEHRFIALPVRLAPGVNDMFFRVQSTSALTLPLRFWTPFEFLAHVQRTTVLQALYFGALVAISLYNLFLSFSLRDRRFVWYVLFTVTFCAGMLSGNGYGRLYFWPQGIEFDRVAQPFFLCLAAACSMAFSNAFLGLGGFMPRTARLLRGAELLMLGFALLFFGAAFYQWPLQSVYLWLIAVVVLTGVMIMVASARALMQGRKGIRFFILAWTCLWLGVFVASMRMLGWLPSNVWTLYALQISSVLEMLLLAFALADIVYQERAQSDQVKASALRLEQQMVMQLQLSEERLEQAVLNRTQQLQQAMDKQQLILDQYVRFGSLISHEFRNPLGIIQSQISLLRRQNVMAESEGVRRLDTMDSAVRRLSQLFERWLQGGRLHHLEKDLNIESLRIDWWLNHLEQDHPQYFASHRVRISFADVACDPSLAWWVQADDRLLEIAVLNLLDNACKYSPPGTEVLIELRRATGLVGIAVIDQGSGIDVEQQGLVFQDYVRLKPEGPVHGIGLGLAFVKRIAVLMQGSIELKSLPGQGCTFCLWLPSNPPR